MRKRADKKHTRRGIYNKERGKNIRRGYTTRKVRPPGKIIRW